MIALSPKLVALQRAAKPALIAWCSPWPWLSPLLPSPQTETANQSVSQSITRWYGRMKTGFSSFLDSHHPTEEDLDRGAQGAFVRA